MSKVFVTGSAGFIGYHVCRRLLREGNTVIGFDAITDYYDPALKHARHKLLAEFPLFTPVIASLEDFNALEAALGRDDFDIVIHLAAQAGVRYSLENPRSYLNSNLAGSFNLFECVKRMPLRHLLLASTSSIYGANEIIPFGECDRADEPLSLYAATKKSMELMAHSYAHLFRIPTTAFRFFTVYGPWGRPDMAAFKFVSAILRREPIDIYGGGEMSRDFTFVDDLVESIVRLVEIVPCECAPIQGDSLSSQAPFRVVNIGGGQPVALLDFVNTIESTLGKTAIRTMRPMQSGDVPRTFANPDLLFALTNYKPTTPIDVGIRAFVDWYRTYYQT